MAGLMSVASLSAQSLQSLLDQAKAAFLSAQKMESALNDKSAANRKRADYLRLIDAYQRVYLITPHTAYADDALVAVARLYEDIQDPSDAIKTLRFMIRDYPQSPFKAGAERDIDRLQNNRDVKDVKEAVTEKSADSTLKPAETAAAPASPSEKKNITVENVRYWEGPNSVRVVVDVSGDVRYTQGEAKSPDRVFVDLASAKLNHALLNKQWPVHSGLLQQIRVGQFDNTTVRVVLDLGNTGSVTSFILRDPNRLIIDVLGKGAPALTRTSENPYAAPPDSSALVASSSAPASTQDAPIANPQIASVPAAAGSSAAPPVTAVALPPPPSGPAALPAGASGANPTPATKLTNGGGTS
jgi:N-acetylmuramoyl-L-alanine amidase